MSKIGKELPKEYSDRFDELRQNRVNVSYYKYGSAADNFGMRLVNALESHDMCIKKYLETGNTEYLCDKDAFFRATDSSESAGISGISVNELNRDKHFEAVVG